MRRDKSNLNNEEFCNDLSFLLFVYFANLRPLTEEKFDNNFNEFVNLVKVTINKHAPLKRLSRKEQKLIHKPWLPKTILISIKTKRKLFKSHYQLGNNTQCEYYKAYANKLTKIKTLSQKNYFESELYTNRNDSRKVWEILKKVLPSRSTKFNDIPVKLFVNDIKTDDPEVILRSFNNLFL